MSRYNGYLKGTKNLKKIDTSDIGTKGGEDELIIKTNEKARFVGERGDYFVKKLNN